MENDRKIPTIWIPGSKSHSIRVLLIAAFAKGVSRIRNLLFSSDTEAVIDAIKRLGCILEYNEDDKILTVDSTHLAEGLSSVILDMANSGTGTYLMMGFAASLGIPVTITGDESLCSRPIKPLVEAYRALGCKVEDTDGYPPFTITGPLKGGKAVIECRTSQYLSSLLFASSMSESPCYIECPILFEKPYVGMSLRYLDEHHILYEISEDLEKSRVEGNDKWMAKDSTVSGDWSSASFFLAYAALNGIKLRLRGLDPEDSQGDKRVAYVLEKMGANIKWLEDGIEIEGPEKLKGGEFDLNDIPDSLPILSAISTLSSEDVKLYNVENARIKETDRIWAMRTELEKLGAHITEFQDGMTIHHGYKLHGGKVSGHEDHRIIMALSILDTAMNEKIEIDSVKKASVTFPEFFNTLESVQKELEK